MEPIRVEVIHKDGCSYAIKVFVVEEHRLFSIVVFKDNEIIATNLGVRFEYISEYNPMLEEIIEVLKRNIQNGVSLLDDLPNP